LNSRLIESDSPYLDPLVAATYHAITASAQFAYPARELVRQLAVARGARALDVGCGTGVVRDALAQAIGSGHVVGIDPSIAMLRAGSSNGALVAGTVPRLPFDRGVFDIVAASFVLSHVADPDAALADMARVCKVNGRIGITAWGTLPNPVGAVWKEIAATVASADELGSAFRRVIPSEDRLASGEGLQDLFGAAGLGLISIAALEYTISLSLEDFVTVKAASLERTLLRVMFDANGWTRFTRDVTEALRRRFGSRIEYVRDFSVATGTRTAD